MRPLKPQGDGAGFSALEDCNTVGILVGILGIGLQDGYDENDPQNDEYLLTFETPNETGEDGRPYHFTRQVKISFHEKANLRSLLEALNGKKIPDEKVKFTGIEAEDAATADFCTSILHKAVGKACLIDIAKYKKLNGYDGNKITGWSKLPKGMASGEPQTMYGFFDLDDPDWDLFSKFPQWQQDVCNKDSYAALMDGTDNSKTPFDEPQTETDDADW